MNEDEPVEIERKFLVETPPALDGLDFSEVRQGYLTRPEDSVEIRLRRKGGACFMTVKSAGDLQRREYEIEIGQEQFDALWPATLGRRVEKRRYTGMLPEGEMFELDVFAGPLAPLMLVEVEFASVREANGFTPPGWFGRDVDIGRQFQNGRRGVRARWTDEK